MILDVKDKPGCKTSYEVLNKFFGKNYEGYQKAFRYLDEAETIGVWFPKMSIKDRGSLKAQSTTKEWFNTLSDDGTEIHMFNKVGLKANRKDDLHITFAKASPDSDYTFIGVFKRDISRSTFTDHYLKLVSKTIDVSIWSNGNSIYKFDEKYLFGSSVEDDLKLIDEIEAETSIAGLSGESREAIVNVRCNQGIFRERLLQRYSKCCLCNVSNSNLLIASHIKPWSDSDGKEKLDVNNGFIMCPNHDKLFDQGWITFDDSGNILISNDLSETDKVFMNVREGMKVDVRQENAKYLKYHRDNIFRD